MSDVDVAVIKNDIEYIKEAIDDLKGFHEANLACVRSIELDVEKHKTLFKVLGAALVALYASLTAILWRVLF